MRLSHLSAVLACLCSTVIAGADGESYFEETFSDVLDDGWQWVHPVPEDRRIEDGRLGLLVSPGGLFEEDREGRNFLLRDALRDLDWETGDILISVDLSHAPEGLYENAGLILYQDDDNYIVVTKESYPGHDPSPRVQVVVERAGEATIPFYAPYDDAEISLAFRLHADTVEGLYRADGNEWVSLGEVPKLSGPRPRVGVKASYGVEGDRRWAWFDNLRVGASSED